MTTFLEESFEGTGYEESWSETIENGQGTIDEDSSGPGSLPSGGGSQCCKFEQAAYYRDIYIEWTPSSDKTEFYFRTYVYIDTAGIGDGSEYRLISFKGNAREQEIRLKNSGFSLYLYFRWYNKGDYSYHVSADIGPLSEDSWYRVELYYKAGNGDGEWEIRLYNDADSLVDSDSESSLDIDGDLGTDGYLRVGIWADPDDAATIYYDLIKANDGDGWIGAESGGATTHEASVSDGISFGDSPAGRADFQAVIADGISLGDIDLNLAQLRAQLTDRIVLSDSPVVEIKLVATLADGITLTDTNSARADYTAAVTDGVKLGEAIAATLQAIAQAADGIVLSDDPSWATTIAAVAEDGIVLSDTAAVILRKFAMAADGIVLSDTGQVTATFRAECADAVQFTDAVLAVASLIAAVSDSIVLSDIPSETSQLPTGELIISFTINKATINFVLAAPAMEFGLKKPGITFQ